MKRIFLIAIVIGMIVSFAAPAIAANPYSDPVQPFPPDWYPFPPDEYITEDDLGYGEPLDTCISACKKFISCVKDAINYALKQYGNKPLM